ncbi:MAG: exodeoxyribonuclease VII small subunit [Anaerolineae bacterium]|nr:exodeoxyribonuclease VII small subunit [Anaerolineae bacterium]
MQDMTFEAAFAELNEVVQQLEASDLNLEDMIALYERGQKLAAYCQVQLDRAELRVTKLNGAE